MKKTFAISFLIFTSILLICLQSCWIYSFTGASISPEVKSVTIPTFSNNAYQVVPSLAENLTEKLKDKFIKELNLTLEENDGHLQFSGNITNYNVGPASITGDDVAATSRLTVSVKVSFKNQFEPENDFETSFSSYVDFDSNTDFASIESELVDEIIEMLVQDIFNKAVNNW